jgi:hypothetical protein
MAGIAARRYRRGGGRHGGRLHLPSKAEYREFQDAGRKSMVRTPPDLCELMERRCFAVASLKAPNFSMFDSMQGIESSIVRPLGNLKVARNIVSC